MKSYIGIDNGVTGSIAIINPNKGLEIGHPAICLIGMRKTPVVLQQNYTKTKKNINRLNIKEMKQILDDWILAGDEVNSLAIIERPMVNPGRFQATLSAMRCMEATLCALESRSIPYMFVDSKQWQKCLLPAGCEKEELKHASHDIGIRLFPSLKEIIDKHGDADSILIAEWARREQV